jgi:chromosome segregation ATPase
MKFFPVPNTALVEAPPLIDPTFGASGSEGSMPPATVVDRISEELQRLEEKRVLQASVQKAEAACAAWEEKGRQAERAPEPQELQRIKDENRELQALVDGMDDEFAELEAMHSVEIEEMQLLLDEYRKQNTVLEQLRLDAEMAEITAESRARAAEEALSARSEAMTAGTRQEIDMLNRHVDEIHQQLKASQEQAEDLRQAVEDAKLRAEEELLKAEQQTALWQQSLAIAKAEHEAAIRTANMRADEAETKAHEKVAQILQHEHEAADEALEQYKTQQAELVARLQAAESELRALRGRAGSVGAAV